jgi:hypothetical protein
MIGPKLIDWSVANIAGLEITNCGAAGHHAPEDQPENIAAAIVAWADGHCFRADNQQTGDTAATLSATSARVEPGAPDAQVQS